MILRRDLWILALGIFAIGLRWKRTYSAKIGSPPAVSPASTDEITVSAAISLKGALDEISHLYSIDHPFWHTTTPNRTGRPHRHLHFSFAQGDGFAAVA